MVRRACIFVLQSELGQSLECNLEEFFSVSSLGPTSSLSCAVDSTCDLRKSPTPQAGPASFSLTPLALHPTHRNHLSRERVT